MIGYVAIVVGLLLFIAARWLPGELGQAGEPEPPSEVTELAVLPGDTAFFVTMRPGDFTRDSLARVFSEATEMFSYLEEKFDLKLADMERITLVALAKDSVGVQIVRSRKAIDTRKMLARLKRGKGVPRFKDKDKDGRAEKMEAREKKIGDKTVYYYGPDFRWTTGLCVVDRHAVVHGNMGALEALLGSKEKPTAELKALLTEAGKHSMVVGFQGKPLRALFNNEYRRYGRAKDKARDAVRDEGKEGPVLLPFEALPYKPLVMMKSALVTVNIGDDYRAHGKASFPSKEAADQADHSLKTLLYVLREFAATVPEMDRGLKPLAPVMDSVQTAFKSARIVRKGNSLETSVRLSVDGDLAKKVSKEMDAERKRIEEERKSRFKDKGFKREFKDK
jgi:hypothetical protein